MNILEWVKNLPTWIKNLIGFITTLVAFILLIRTNFHLGISVTVIVLWVILVWNLVSILLSKNNVERHGLISHGKANYKYPRLRPWAIAGLFIAVVLMVALIGYTPTRNFAKDALLGTPTLSPTPTALPTVTATPRPPDLTMLATTTGEGFCSSVDQGYIYLRKKSVIDIAINNNSDRIVLLTSVALLPQDIHGEPFLAGGLGVAEKYSVSLADWLWWMAYTSLGEKPPTPKLEPVYVPEITADKYSIQSHTAERFQIIVGVDPNKFRDDYLLYGSIIVEILLDNGETLRSAPLEVMICGSLESEENISDAEAMFYEGVFALNKGDIETAITKIREAASYDLEIIEKDSRFGDLCEQSTKRGYANEVLFACDRMVQSWPNDEYYREISGIARTIAGDFTGAIEDFEFSVSLDIANGVGEEALRQRQGWITQLKSGQNPFLGETMLYKGVRALYDGNLANAIEYFHQALEIGFELKEDVTYWQRLCEHGSLNHMADQVLFACDHAVELAPENGDVRDSRGIARALTGDYTGAIEDFEFAVSVWEGSDLNQEKITLRKAWMSELREGKNPLTEEVLTGLQLR